MSAIPLHSLWIPRRKKLWLPTPTWAMGHLRRKGHHLAKTHSSHHLVKGCGSDRYIQARKCSDGTPANYWFRLKSGDDTIVVFTTPAGAQIHLDFWFKVDEDCYYVDDTCTISSSPGTIVSSRDTLNYHSSCECGPDLLVYFPVYDCCLGDFVGYVLKTDFEEWQADNATDYVVGVSATKICWRADTSDWIFNAPDPHISFTGLSPAINCAEGGCCCCGVFCCPYGTVITATVIYSFEITCDDPMNPANGSRSGTLTASCTLTGSPGDPRSCRFNNGGDDPPPSAVMDFTVSGCTDKYNGQPYVEALSGVQDPVGVGGAQTGTDTVIGPGGGGGGFDFFFGCSGATGTGSWLISLSGC